MTTSKHSPNPGAGRSAADFSDGFRPDAAVGVLHGDGRLEWVFEIGTAVPTVRRRVNCRIDKDVKAGAGAAALCFPIVRGAGRSRHAVLGAAVVPTDRISADLAAGSRAVLGIKLDAGHRPAVSVYLPDNDDVIDDALVLGHHASVVEPETEEEKGPGTAEAEPQSSAGAEPKKRAESKKRAEPKKRAESKEHAEPKKRAVAATKQPSAEPAMEKPAESALAKPAAAAAASAAVATGVAAASAAVATGAAAGPDSMSSASKADELGTVGEASGSAPATPAAAVEKPAETPPAEKPAKTPPAKTPPAETPPAKQSSAAVAGAAVAGAAAAATAKTPPPAPGAPAPDAPVLGAPAPQGAGPAGQAPESPTSGSVRVLRPPSPAAPRTATPLPGSHGLATPAAGPPAGARAAGPAARPSAPQRPARPVATPAGARPAAGAFAAGAVAGGVAESPREAGPDGGTRGGRSAWWLFWVVLFVCVVAAFMVTFFACRGGGAAGVVESGSPSAAPSATSTAVLSPDDVETLDPSLRLQAPGFTPEVSGADVTRADTAVVVTPEEGLFDSASTEISGDGREMLRSLAGELRGRTDGLYVLVVGHTDSQPMQPYASYADNVALGMARAVAVVDFLRLQTGMPYKIFVAATADGSQPLDTNETEAGRARNRTVVIKVTKALQPDE